VHFAIPSYTSSGSNKFFYKMPGIISEWIEVPNGNINFSSLPIGKHILYLKGSNNDGIFSDEQKVYVIVKPFWYQTNLIKMVTVLCIAALVFAFVRWQIRSIRKEASFKQKIAETEMQALRAQMNPHFIFNSLNSIENFIMQNEKRLASDYLNKFARLIRMILDSSRNELVPLSKDMESLQLYIDLEQLRFNNKFSYQSFIDPALLNGDYRVPSLLIQPYVENAIVHGLANSEENNLNLSITVTLENDAIKYIIQDNGVGRKKANEYNLQNKPYHKSVGLQITEDRVNMFNQQAMGNDFIRFTDLYDENKEPGGTKVEIIIKAN
jgi:LytS/YehU family sensor histidine kinase